MANYKEQKIEDLFMRLAADFLQRESNGTSLITVTGVVITERTTKVTVLISVLPEEKEKEALDFVKRKRTEFKEYVKSHAKLHMLPFVDFEIDYGEKNRQRIDQLSS